MPSRSSKLRRQARAPGLGFALPSIAAGQARARCPSGRKGRVRFGWAVARSRALHQPRGASPGAAPGGRSWCLNRRAPSGSTGFRSCCPSMGSSKSWSRLEPTPPLSCHESTQPRKSSSAAPIMSKTWTLSIAEQWASHCHDESPSAPTSATILDFPGAVFDPTPGWSPTPHIPVRRGAMSESVPRCARRTPT